MPTGELKQASLLTIASGAVPEMFDAAFAKAMENIDDPNTDATAKRRITIDVELEPDEERQTITATLSVKSKLAGIKSQRGLIFAVRDGAGKLHGYNHDLNQGNLFESPGEKGVRLVREAKKE